MAVFSGELQGRLKTYFDKKYDIRLTSEQAEVFLSSLADLFLHFADIPSLEEAGSALRDTKEAREAEPDFPDLISPHNCKPRN